MKFIEDAYKRLLSYKELGDKTLQQLSDADFFYRPNEVSNSIAIIIQHMYGNMMSRFTNLLTEDGEKSWRKRDAEFEPSELTRQDLIDCWNTGWSMVLNTIKNLQESDLDQEITIRGEKILVYDAILRQLGHYAYHVGQIVWIAKFRSGENWEGLSIAKGQSDAYNKQLQDKQT